jgi:signal transduction histidine kinase/DNA-binding response OmpR family regulator
MTDLRTLLIVDDCAEDRKIYRRYLAKDPHHTYEIIEANSAENGLALYQKVRSDVVLLDFCLPDMTGLEFLEQLQQQVAETSLPVIMLTGQGDEAIAVQAMKRGAQDYLVKTYLKPDSLQLAVRNVIRQARLQAQLHKNQERQRLIAMTALQIRQSLNLSQILNRATEELQRLLQCDRVVVYQFAPDRSGTIVAESVATGWTSALNIAIQDTFFQNSSGPLYAEGQALTVPNVDTTTGLSTCYLELLKQFEVKAKLAVPILLHANSKTTPQLWGLLIAHQCSAERQWQPDEIELFSELSVQLAIAIQQAELLAQTQAALSKEKELNLFRSQIIATVSHEYRTPLASILAAASTLEQHHAHLDESKRTNLVQMIQQKTRHLSGLVDDMLVVKQLELDKTKVKRLPLDLLPFFARLIEDQQEMVGDRVELTYNMSGDLKDFWGDRGLLRQIFANLMVNALKYSPEGGVVACTLMGEGSQVIFSIADEGIGIPPEDRDNLFQAFSRGSNVDTIPGTGLGLAIVKTCVELHDGSLKLESRLGQGTKVTVHLPKHVK